MIVAELSNSTPMYTDPHSQESYHHHQEPKGKLDAAFNSFSPLSVMEGTMGNWKALPTIPDILTSSSSTSKSTFQESFSSLSSQWEGEHNDSCCHDLPISRRPRRVRFAIPVKDEGSQHEADGEVTKWDQEIFKQLWWSKAEVATFYRRSRQEAIRIRQECEFQIESLRELYKEAKSESNSSVLLKLPCASNIIDLASLTAPGVEVRGLEPFLQSSVPQSRLLHVSSLLMIQKAASVAFNTTRGVEDDGQTRLVHLLRTRSLQTSRASRVLARILAHCDELQVADMIQNELMDGCSPSE